MRNEFFFLFIPHPASLIASLRRSGSMICYAGLSLLIIHSVFCCFSIKGFQIFRFHELVHSSSHRYFQTLALQHNSVLYRGFGAIIPLRSNPSSVNIKEPMYAANFARHAPKLGLLPKLELFPKPELFWKVTLFARYLFHPFIFNFRFNQSAATFTRTDAG
jgi:hypothetical protein